MRSFYGIQTTLKSTSKTNAVVLAQHCLRAADAVPEVIETALQEIGSDNDPQNGFLKEVLIASERYVYQWVGRLSGV